MPDHNSQQDQIQPLRKSLVKTVKINARKLAAPTDCQREQPGLPSDFERARQAADRLLRAAHERELFQALNSLPRPFMGTTAPPAESCESRSVHGRSLTDREIMEIEEDPGFQPPGISAQEAVEAFRQMASCSAFVPSSLLFSRPDPYQSGVRKDCVNYSGNKYLKCAVAPTSVCEGCQHYEPRQAPPEATTEAEGSDDARNGELLHHHGHAVWNYRQVRMHSRQVRMRLDIDMGGFDRLAGSLTSLSEAAQKAIQRNLKVATRSPSKSDA